MSTPAAARVAIVDNAGIPRPELLAQALERGAFWDALHAATRAAGVTPAALRVVIKPDLGAFAPGSPAATDPALVEWLIDLLHDRGYGDVQLCASADSAFFWAENRDVAVLADLLGYRYCTPAGRAYDVLDLSADTGAATFDPRGVLADSLLGSAWRDAHFRICFARNKTDEQEGYALCLHALLDVLPLADKDYYYRQRIAPGAAVCELQRAAPAQFALIDATVSAHGSGGARAPRPLVTGCILAGRDVALVDFVGALKMGLDPYTSPLAAEVYRAGGLPPRYAVDGNLATYAEWRNVDPLLRDARRRREQLPAASRLLAPWLQVLDPELFPLKHVTDARLNPHLSRYFADVDADPVARTVLLYLNYAIGACGEWLDAYRVLYDKDALRRREVPLGFDPEAFAPARYLAIRAELDQIGALLADLPPAAPGLRWREVEGATLFEFRRDLPIPFEHFVARVDVARTIQYMNDYIGGRVVELERDADGRVVRQAERNLYLPQPNYLVLYQGKPIDVSKIEVCDYGEQRHRMYWMTVLSENGSATYDDGVVSFMRSARGTEVCISGRQLFTLPPFWQAIDLKLVPDLEAALVTQAYQSFFERTLANFEALVEGRDIRIGRAWHVPADAFDTEPLPVAGLERLALRLVERVQAAVADEGSPAPPVTGARTQAVRVDADGFRHFEAGPDAAGMASARGEAAGGRLAVPVVEFLLGLNAALARDLADLTGTQGPTR